MDNFYFYNKNMREDKYFIHKGKSSLYKYLHFTAALRSSKNSQGTKKNITPFVINSYLLLSYASLAIMYGIKNTTEIKCKMRALTNSRKYNNLSKSMCI